MTALQEASTLYARAREHKRLADQHRKAARRTMEELRALCLEYGFNFEVVTGSVDASHGPTNHPSDHGRQP